MSLQAANTHINKSDNVRSFLSFMEREIQTGQVAYDSGTHTKLTSFIDKLVSNPLDGMIESSLGTDNRIKDMVLAIFDTFINSQKEIINKAYKHVSSYEITYFLILSDDKFETRDSFFSFLDQYEDLGIYHKLPIHFQFLTPTAIGRVGENVEELVISE